MWALCLFVFLCFHTLVLWPAYVNCKISYLEKKLQKLKEKQKALQSSGTK